MKIQWSAQLHRATIIKISTLFGRPFIKRFALLSDHCVSDCGQMVGWIEMPLGTEVGLGPGYSVLDPHLTQLPTERGTAVPTFAV